MASAREMRLRIRSVKNISQVTKALETVSASKVRRAMQAVDATRPYAEKAWKVVVHLASQPAHATLHPLLKERDEIKKVLVVMVSGDRGLAGAYNMNILRFCLDKFGNYPVPVQYLAIGRKGRDLLFRRHKQVIAEFSDLPPAPSFASVSAIGHLAVEEFLEGKVDEVYVAYTSFKNMIRQEPTLRRLLPLQLGPDPSGQSQDSRGLHGVFTYEPDANEILDQIVSSFIQVQIYQSILESLASEHAARMVAMRNATDSANELVGMLRLEYNKARQQSITNDLLDIASGAEALAKARVQE